MIHAKRKRRCSVPGFKRLELLHDLLQGMLVKGRYNKARKQPMIVVDIVYAAILTVLFSFLLAILENLKK